MLKQRLGIRYGSSSRQLEAALRSSGWELLRRMSKAQKAELPALPAFCTPDALEVLCWKALQLMGKVPADAAPPPMPVEVPSPHEIAGPRVRPRMACAYDLFCKLNDAEIELKTSDKRHQVKYAGKSRRQQFRMAAGELWKKQDTMLKEAYALEAEKKAPAGRDPESGNLFLQLLSPDSACARCRQFE